MLPFASTGFDLLLQASICFYRFASASAGLHLLLQACICFCRLASASASLHLHASAGLHMFLQACICYFRLASACFCRLASTGASSNRCGAPRNSRVLNDLLMCTEAFSVASGSNEASSAKKAPFHLRHK